MAEVIAGFGWALERLRSIQIWMEGIFFAFFVMWGVGFIWILVLNWIWGLLLLAFGLVVWIVILAVQLGKPEWFEGLAPPGMRGEPRLNWIKAIQVGNLINWIICIVVLVVVAGVQTGWSAAGFNVWYQGAAFIGATFALAALYAWLRREFMLAMKDLSASGAPWAGALMPLLVVLAAVVLVGFGVGFGAVAPRGWIIAAVIWVGTGIGIAVIMWYYLGAKKEETQRVQRIWYRPKQRDEV